MAFRSAPKTHGARMNRSIWEAAPLRAGVLAALLFSSGTLRAQFLAGADVSGGLGRVGAGAWHRTTLISPTVLVRSRFGFVEATNLVVEEPGRLMMPRASMDVALSSPTFGPI